MGYYHSPRGQRHGSKPASHSTCSKNKMFKRYSFGLRKGSEITTMMVANWRCFYLSDVENQAQMKPVAVCMVVPGCSLTKGIVCTQGFEQGAHQEAQHDPAVWRQDGGVCTGTGTVHQQLSSHRIAGHVRAISRTVAQHRMRDVWTRWCTVAAHGRLVIIT